MMMKKKSLVGGKMKAMKVQRSSESQKAHPTGVLLWKKLWLHA